METFLTLKNWMLKAQRNGVCTIVAADIMSLYFLKSPGSYGADVVVGTTQRFGIPWVTEDLMLPFLLPKVITKEIFQDELLVKL